MKRHPALQDLSRDHHHVLFRCQRFRRMLAAGAAWSELTPYVDEFLLFFQTDVSPHFEEEDRFVVPQAQRHGGAALRRVADKLQDEHRAFRRAIAELADARSDAVAARDRLARLEPLLTAHVHEEETQLFEGVQGVLSEEALQELGRRSAAFRAQHRAPDATGPRPGRG